MALQLPGGSPELPEPPILSAGHHQPDRDQLRTDHIGGGYPNHAVARQHRMVRILVYLTAASSLAASLQAQGRGEPGKSIGSVAVRGNLIVMTLNEGALGKESLFDLA